MHWKLNNKLKKSSSIPFFYNIQKRTSNHRLNIRGYSTNSSSKNLETESSEKINTIIKELELEKINKTKTFEDIKLKQRENKSIRRKEIKLAKSKNQKKRIRKNVMSNISELNEKNNLILNKLYLCFSLV